MTEAATVFWVQTATAEGSYIKFESLENAVRFAMEELSETDRSTAFIQIDNGDIYLEDIQKMYATSSPQSRKKPRRLKFVGELNDNDLSCRRPSSNAECR